MATQKSQQPQPARPKPIAPPKQSASTQRNSTWQVFNDFAAI